VSRRNFGVACHLAITQLEASASDRIVGIEFEDSEPIYRQLFGELIVEAVACVAAERLFVVDVQVVGCALR
jgi:hypothetical protein